jgi:hypothetical protein
MAAPIGKGGKQESRVIPSGRLTGDHIVTLEKEKSTDRVPHQTLYDAERKIDIDATAGFKGQTATKAGSLFHRVI